MSRIFTFLVLLFTLSFCFGQSLPLEERLTQVEKRVKKILILDENNQVKGYQLIPPPGGLVKIGNITKEGRFVRFSDDLWFWDPQNGDRIFLKNKNDKWGILTGNFQATQLDFVDDEGNPLRGAIKIRKEKEKYILYILGARDPDSDKYKSKDSSKRIDVNTDEIRIGTRDENFNKKSSKRVEIDADEIFIKGKIIHKSGIKWPDFVFASDYNLLSLEELEKYIKKNKHLPSIPTAEEMAKNGTSIGDIQNKFIQKIEEITLYTIKQNKQINTLQKENQKLRQDMDLLKKNIKKLLEIVKDNAKK